MASDESEESDESDERGGRGERLRVGETMRERGGFYSRGSFASPAVRGAAPRCGLKK